MIVYKHLLLSLIPAMIIYYFSKTGSLLFILITVLMDIDHYPVYVLKFKDLSVRRAYNYFKGQTRCLDIAFFHSIEFVILVFVMSFFYKILFFIFFGLVYHLIIDIYEVHHEQKQRTLSLIAWLRRKNEKI